MFLTFVESDIDLTSLRDRLVFFRAKRTSFWGSLANRHRGAAPLPGIVW